MLTALGFLTVVGPSRLPDARTFRWFPLVGSLVGAALGALWWAAVQLVPPGVAAAIVVSADLGLTGLLHIDGLADCADGLLPPLARERRLAVMRQPDVGAFAVAVVPSVLLVRWSALAAQPVAPLLLVALWSLSRTMMAAVPGIVPYARREGGLASAFLGAGRPWLAVPAVAAALGLAVAARGVTGAAAVAAALAAAAAVVALAHRRLGGFTGDVLGAAAVVAETAGLVVASA
jgi:adenosylcobinamide-GDP ribazoletransferase